MFVLYMYLHPTLSPPPIPLPSPPPSSFGLPSQLLSAACDADSYIRHGRFDIIACPSEAAPAWAAAPPASSPIDVLLAVAAAIATAQ